eukprot:TRINITY_DN49109_c0_g1_i1.p1 TRINITY_DN49109_c0_g1~~TRINITY_DN49109_c0_g1_i1.p1  ORF type:complete len:439 (+),score=83.90 TRINITY_DN49109_c0_g1_i1:38-1318(+)
MAHKAVFPIVLCALHAKHVAAASLADSQLQKALMRKGAQSEALDATAGSGAAADASASAGQRQAAALLDAMELWVSADAAAAAADGGEQHPKHWREGPHTIPRALTSVSLASLGLESVLQVRPWEVAVAVYILASLLAVVGFNLQKSAIAAQARNAEWKQLGEAVMSPTWFLGFCLGVLMPLPLHAVAYYNAPMSLLAPLSGATVVLNIFVTPYFLNESWEYWPDAAASALIVLGMYMTTSTGSVGQDGRHMTVHRFYELAGSTLFCGCLSVLLVALLASWGYQAFYRKQIRETAKARPSAPPMAHVMQPALIAAGMSVFTNIGFKSAMEFLKAGSRANFALLMVLILPIAVFQLQVVNYGMRLYSQLLFYPVYHAVQVIVNSIYGAIFFQEYREIFSVDSRMELFVMGVVIVASGIALLGERKHA